MYRRFLILAIVSGALGAPAAVAGSAPVVSFSSLGEVTQIVVELPAGFEYDTHHLANPDRIYFDIQVSRPDAIRASGQEITIGDALVRQVRISANPAGNTRVVLDLAQPVEFAASRVSNP